MRGRENPVTMISAGANRLAWREYDGLVLLVWRGIRGALRRGPMRPVAGKPCAAAAASAGLRPRDASEAAAQRWRDPGDPSR
jgi:hypothetical protein